MNRRFWSKVRMGGSDECWDWTASVFRGEKGGYGRFLLAGKIRYAHRVAWRLTNGEIPDGLFVLHKCDNRRCCNPAHLFLGTKQDNADDMVAKGRHGTKIHPNYLPRGASHWKVKITEAQAVGIMARLLMGVPRMRVAEEFGTTYSIVHSIHIGRAWKHLFVQEAGVDA